MCDDSFITALFQLDEFPADCEPFFESEDDEESSTDGKSHGSFFLWVGSGPPISPFPPQKKKPYFCLNLFNFKIYILNYTRQLCFIFL